MNLEAKYSFFCYNGRFDMCVYDSYRVYFIALHVIEYNKWSELYQKFQRLLNSRALRRHSPGGKESVL